MVLKHSNSRNTYSLYLDMNVNCNQTSTYVTYKLEYLVVVYYKINNHKHNKCGFLYIMSNIKVFSLLFKSSHLLQTNSLSVCFITEIKK